MRPQGAGAEMGIYKYYGAQILEERPPAGMVRQNTSVEHLRCRQQYTRGGLSESPTLRRWRIPVINRC